MQGSTGHGSGDVARRHPESSRSGAASCFTGTEIGGDFTPHFQPDLVVTTEQVQPATKARAVLLDARPVGEDQGKRRVAGTIPGAPNLPSSALYDGSSQGAGHQPVALYDGSMAAWAADPARPVQ